MDDAMESGQTEKVNNRSIKILVVIIAMLSYTYSIVHINDGVPVS